ncbi:RDD family protein [Anaplasma capra]|uniref:RDD family protein n=1 Tax=Anaplasma capra TaxID=1562740 RepID=UPI0021D56BC0|nr:RDD family protein [Anaplasma capra]MCU7611675.1 RDD family protein [Anaplasma capra]MCU7612175.1 RDD family protein [Anaplasma capra]
MQRLQKVLSWITDKLLFFPFGRSQKLKDGELCYVSGARRCIGTMVDLVIMVLALQLTHAIFFLVLPKSEAAFKAIEKHKMGATLTKEEKILRNKYIYKAVVLQVAQLVIVFVYNVYMWINFSGTVGKLLVGLRVVDEEKLEAMSLHQATKRFFSTVLSGIPLGLGILWSNFDSRKRAWHDMIAKTVVVTNKSLKRYKELHKAGSKGPTSPRDEL